MTSAIARRAAGQDDVHLPIGDEERFAGWGVMGLPFTSGHVLAFRSWPASSVGPAYSSVWHRDPAGRWQMWQTIEPGLACPRYFSDAVERSHVTEITSSWHGPKRLTITIPGVLDWTLDVRPTSVTRLMNAAMSLLPQRAWRSPAVLRAMGTIAAVMLRVGRISLIGRTPNGQRFRAAPNRIAMVRSATASLDGHDLGPIGPVTHQARLGDFWLPQRGIVAMGWSWFDQPPGA